MLIRGLGRCLSRERGVMVGVDDKMYESPNAGWGGGKEAWRSCPDLNPEVKISFEARLIGVRCCACRDDAC